jgi:predicted AlkP superfamily phosphohydrolase/phosphomutase
MKILVMGLDCAAPELLLGEDLPNFRRLMAGGIFGTMESVVPPITVPAWMCLSTGQDPGCLGVYGFRNRVDHSYDGFRTADSRWFRAPTMWDQVAVQGGRSILAGVPPSYPPGRMNGIRVGCFLTPDPARDVFTHPAALGPRINELVGGYPVDVKGFRTEDKDRLLSEIREMTLKHFQVLRHLLTTEPWDYFHFVEIGLDRIHHGFWKHHDPRHVQHDPASPYRDVVRDYYRLLDHEIGSLLEALDDETLLLVVSDHGARALDGGFCVNEWLLREGYLVLRTRPKKVTTFEELDVDWSRTRAWSSGGYYARVFLNVRGREPEGTVSPEDYDRVREELVLRLESTADPEGRPLGTRAFKPQEIYARVEGVAPDLIVHFGELAWRAIGGVGYGRLHVQENDTGPDDCNHAQLGAFILAGPGVPDAGEVQGARLLDVAPTLLSAAGYDLAPSMLGRDLLGGGVVPPRLSPEGRSPPQPPPPGSSDALIRERLRSLGYLG